MKAVKNGLLIILIGLIAAGCASSMSGSTYSRDQARMDMRRLSRLMNR